LTCDNNVDINLFRQGWEDRTVQNHAVVSREEWLVARKALLQRE
jgi:hypothetical protein